MSTKRNSSVDPVTLNGYEDWEAWNHELMSRAVAANLWECIDPDNDEDFLEKPAKPGFSQFRKKADIQTRNTRASSHAATPAPEPVTNEPARSAEDLTTEARQQYGLLWSIFQHDTKQYDIQRAAIKELKSWILKTVSENYIRTSCPPQDDLRVWYKNLKENVGVDDERLKADVRDRYRKSVIPLKTTKTLDKWITQWEKAMSEAKAKNIGEVSETSSWFDDFTLAVQDIMSTWITAYRMNKKEAIRNGSLSYRTVGNDFRDQLRVQGKSINKPAKIAKGSFGPTFAGVEEPDRDKESEQQDKDERETKDKKNKKGSKRKRDSTVEALSRESQEHSGIRQSCRVCGGIGHLLTGCFYAFPKKAPPYFKEHPVKRRIVDLVLASDTALAEEVRRLSKEKTSGEEN
jgi:hypothetical protein